VMLLVSFSIVNVFIVFILVAQRLLR
jgi:hypothetical protein